MRISDWSSDVCSSDLARPEGSGAFAAGMADALIEDAVRARIAQFGPEPLGMDIAVGIVEMRVAVRETANVVETGLEVDGIDAHVDLLGGLVGRGEKSGAVVPRFRDRGVQRQARIKDAEAAVGKTAALGIEMGEGRHDRCRARSEEHTSELQSLMRISYAVFCLTKKKNSLHHSLTPLP